FAYENGVWNRKQRLSAADNPDFSYMGISVAFDHDQLLVSQLLDSNGLSSIYVYKKQGGLWTQQSRFFSGAVTKDNFGMALAVENGTALAYAWSDGDNDEDTENTVLYSFTRSGDVWSKQQTILLPSDVITLSLNLSGDFALLADMLGQTVYNFRRQNGTWTAQSNLNVPAGYSG